MPGGGAANFIENKDDFLLGPSMLLSVTVPIPTVTGNQSILYFTDDLFVDMPRGRYRLIKIKGFSSGSYWIVHFG